MRSAPRIAASAKMKNQRGLGVRQVRMMPTIAAPAATRSTAVDNATLAPASAGVRDAHQMPISQVSVKGTSGIIECRGSNDEGWTMNQSDLCRSVPHVVLKGLCDHVRFKVESPDARKQNTVASRSGLVHSFTSFWGKAKLEAKRLDGLEALFQVGGGKLPGERLGDFLVVVLKS